MSLSSEEKFKESQAGVAISTTIKLQKVYMVFSSSPHHLSLSTMVYKVVHDCSFVTDIYYSKPNPTITVTFPPSWFLFPNHISSLPPSQGHDSLFCMSCATKSNGMIKKYFHGRKFVKVVSSGHGDIKFLSEG